MCVYVRVYNYINQCSQSNETLVLLMVLTGHCLIRRMNNY
jgi:hypothetical protein